MRNETGQKRVRIRPMDFVVILLLSILLSAMMGCNNKRHPSKTKGYGKKPISTQAVSKPLTAKEVEEGNNFMPTGDEDTKSRESLYFRASNDEGFRDNDFVEIAANFNGSSDTQSPPPVLSTPATPVKNTAAVPSSTVKTPESPGLSNDVKMALHKAVATRATNRTGIVIKGAKSSGEWTLVSYQSQFRGKTYNETAILKKKGTGYNMIRETGSGPTTDFLKLTGVPKGRWADLIGRDVIEIQRQILEHERSYNRDALYMNVNRAGDWALVSWIVEPSGGMMLMKKMGKRWVSVSGRGGVISDETIKEYGVPSEIISKLKGIAEKSTPFDNVPGISDLPSEPTGQSNLKECQDDPLKCSVEYYKLIGRKDFSTAYSLRSPRQKEGESYDKWKSKWSNNVKLRVKGNKKLSGGDSNRKMVIVTVYSEDENYASGKVAKADYSSRVTLVFEKGGWWIDSIETNLDRKY